MPRTFRALLTAASASLLVAFLARAADQEPGVVQEPAAPKTAETEQLPGNTRIVPELPSTQTLPDNLGPGLPMGNSMLPADVMHQDATPVPPAPVVEENSPPQAGCDEHGYFFPRLHRDLCRPLFDWLDQRKITPGPPSRTYPDPYHAGCFRDVRRCAIPSDTGSYIGYMVGGGAGWRHGEPRYPSEGTWGWDYAGWFFKRRVHLLYWHGRRYQGGTGAYKTDGPKYHPAPETGSGHE